MNQFYLSSREKLSLINPLFKNFGAHLCIYVSGKTYLTQRSDRIFHNEFEPIKLVRLVGYIQMDEQLYLRWLPAKFHRMWLNEFQNRQHLVIT
jgi:hypothetical protein